MQRQDNASLCILEKILIIKTIFFKSIFSSKFMVSIPLDQSDRCPSRHAPTQWAGMLDPISHFFRFPAPMTIPAVERFDRHRHSLSSCWVRRWHLLMWLSRENWRLYVEDLRWCDSTHPTCFEVVFPMWWCVAAREVFAGHGRFSKIIKNFNFKIYQHLI